MAGAEDERDHRLPRTVVPRRYEVRIEPDLASATFSGTAAVDVEVRRLVTRAQEREKSVLSHHREALRRLAEVLREQETLQDEELRKALRPRQKAA